MNLRIPDGDGISGSFNWIGGFGSIGPGSDDITQGIKGSIKQDGWKEGINWV